MTKFNRFKSIIILFEKPYDLFESKRNRLIISISISGFVWFFLLIFGVFDFDYFSFWDRLFYTGIYSLFCFFTLFINFFLIQDLVIKRLTLLISMAWSLWFMFCIGISNFLLTTIIFKWEEFSMKVLAKNLAFTLSLGMIIAPAIMLVYYNYTLKKRLFNFTRDDNDARLDTSPLNRKEIIVINSSYKTNSFEVEANNILYIESSDNYLNVFYLNNNKVHHKFVRNTLSSFENSQVHPALIRCHRSFIININRVRSIKGNAGGYKLVIEYSERDIPVSRKYSKSVFSLLKI